VNSRARRRSTGAGLTIALVLAIAGGASVVVRRATQPAAVPPPPVAGPPTAAPPGPASSAYAPPSYAVNAPQPYPVNGPGTFVVARGNGPVLGSAGPLRRYRLAVENGAPVSLAEFTMLVEATLGDPRSWIGGRDVQLRRVPGRSDFTIYLATPGTANRICRAGGVDIRRAGQPYTSCRVGGQVVINLARYLTGVEGYGAPLPTYRQYAINHEVGHALGYGHELCPGPGQPAPVMQQQTLGLLGCVANAWPYLEGRRYAGPLGEVPGA